MKINKKSLYAYLYLFAAGFAGSFQTFRHDGGMPFLQKVGIACLIGLLMIPLGVLIAIPLAWLFGAMPPKTREVKPKDTDRE